MCGCLCSHLAEDVDFLCTPCGEGLLCPVGSSIAGLLNSTGNPNEPRVVNGYSSEQFSPLNTCSLICFRSSFYLSFLITYNICTHINHIFHISIFVFILFFCFWFHRSVLKLLKSPDSFRYRCSEFACPGGAPGSCGGGRIGPTCGRCPSNEFFSEVPCNAALNRSKQHLLNAPHLDNDVTTVFTSVVTCLCDMQDIAGCQTECLTQTFVSVEDL